MMKEICPTPDVLDSLARISFSNLSIFVDRKELLDEIDPNSIDLLLDAYHRSYARFLEYVEGKHPETIPFLSFPKGGLVLTKSPEIFKALYHSPDRFDQLPNWVWVAGYVNMPKSLHVKLVTEPKLYNTQDNSNSCHELTHAILPDILGLPGSFLSETWPTWIHEAFTVGANQLRTKNWLKKELKKDNITPPSIESIQTDGIFARDTRLPAENTGYQYCVHITEKLGRQIGQRSVLPWTDSLPLAAVCHLTQKSYEQESNLLQLTEAMGIDIVEVENSVRGELGLMLL